MPGNPTPDQTAAPDVILCECFARDGLQHEATVIPADAKAAIIRKIADVGFRRIEITSFSHPRHVPQFADADAVLEAVPPRPRSFAASARVTACGLGHVALNSTPGRGGTASSTASASANCGTCLGWEKEVISIRRKPTSACLLYTSPSPRD